MKIYNFVLKTKNKKKTHLKKSKNMKDFHNCIYFHNVYVQSDCIFISWKKNTGTETRKGVKHLPKMD